MGSPLVLKGWSSMRCTLELRGAGNSLCIALVGSYAPTVLDEATRGWQRAAIAVLAYPFSGTVETVLAADEIEQCRQSILRFECGQNVVSGVVGQLA